MRALRKFRFLWSCLLDPSNARAAFPCTAALAALVLTACASGGSGPAPTGGETVILAVRHAERAGDAANADLSDAGRARAEAVAAAAARYGVTAVYSTDLCRTAQTGQPAARAAGTPLRVLATGSGAAGLDGCTPPITVAREPAGGAGAAEAAARILAAHRGTAVLVVGHSNTVPALLEALTGESPCPSRIPLDAQQRCFLPESAYGDLFVVRMSAAGDVRVTQERVGSLP